MCAFFLLLLCVVPTEDPVVDHCFLIELNHYHSVDDGRLIYHQVIFWGCDTEKGCNPYVIAYRIYQDKAYAGPSAMRHGVGWRMSWFDSTVKYGVARRVESRYYRETWTLHNPETKNRQHLSLLKRRGLTDPVVESPPEATP